MPVFRSLLEFQPNYSYQTLRRVFWQCLTVSLISQGFEKTVRKSQGMNRSDKQLDAPPCLILPSPVGTLLGSDDQHRRFTSGAGFFCKTGPTLIRRVLSMILFYCEIRSLRSD